MHLQGIAVCISPGCDDTPHRAELLWGPPATLHGLPPTAPHGFSEPRPRVTIWKDTSPQTRLCCAGPYQSRWKQKSPNKPRPAPISIPTVQTTKDWVFPRQVSSRLLGISATQIGVRSAPDKPQYLSTQGEATRTTSQLFHQGRGILASAVSVSSC